jgi:NinB protein
MRMTLTLGPDTRALAARYAATFADGTRVTFEDPERTEAQARLRRRLLAELAQRARCAGVKLTAEDWEALMIGALMTARILPGLDDPRTFVVLPARQRRSKDQENQMIELILAVAAEQGLQLSTEGME